MRLRGFFKMPELDVVIKFFVWLLPFLFLFARAP